MHVRYTTAHKNHTKLQRSPGIFDINDTALHVGALDKALDIWYNTGVGLKKTHKQEQNNDND